MAESSVSPQFEPSSSGLPERLDVQALQAAIREDLCRAGYSQMRHLNLKCDGDVITISGHVPTYYLKQLVQTIALTTPGVGRVNIEVHVC